MKSFKINFKILFIPVVAALMILSSCNKDLESFTDITTPPITPPAGTTIAAYIATNSNYSFLDTALVTTGLYDAVLNQPGSYTLYAPDNNAFRGLLNALFAIPLASPDAVFEGTLKNPAFKSTLTSILLYQIMISKVPTAAFSSVFPNVSYSSKLPLDATGAIRGNLFPSARPGINYINNVPITAPDLFTASNGVVHGTPAIIVPPTGTLKTAIAAEPTLSYFRAAVARADSGAVGISRFDSLLNYALTNMTVLAPNDNAFKTLVYGLVYGKVLALTSDPATADAQANGAVAAGPAFLATNNVSTEMIKGILAYHFFASLTSDPATPYQPNIRVFSVNFPPSTPTFVKTLVNNVVAAHPGISVNATFTGPVVSGLTFTGLGTFPPGGAPYSGTAANAIPVPGIGFDRVGVNGVYYIIDKVLLPQ